MMDGFYLHKNEKLLYLEKVINTLNIDETQDKILPYERTKVINKL